MYFAVVLFVFQFYPVCLFGNLSISDLALLGVKGLNSNVLNRHSSLERGALVMESKGLSKAARELTRE